MPSVESLTFLDSRGDKRRVDFIADSLIEKAGGFPITVVTGHNGSHKSTMLRELVAALTLHDADSTVTIVGNAKGPHRVLCTSGSVADRFPSKDLAGGGRSRFDVPNYAYIGQRAGPNILSKKAPLETMLGFALDSANANRFKSDFFMRAHKFAGVKSRVEFIFQRRQKKAKDVPDLLGRVQNISNDTPKQPSKAKRADELPVSFATAQWLLEEFEYDDFTTLETAILKGGKRLTATLSSDGVECNDFSASALRLGLHLGLIGLLDAQVTPVDGNRAFSLFDLSSGEYHMYTSILGLGFGMTSSTLVLIDEPENSLHPQWQREYMATVIKICGETLVDGHLVVCTHSPLIVATATQDSTIVDLTLPDAQVNVASYGASADELLLSQFGVGSSRNHMVVAAIQRAVSLVERGEFDDSKSKEMEPEIRRILDTLTPDDPLIPVLIALLPDEVEDEPRI